MHSRTCRLVITIAAVVTMSLVLSRGTIRAAAGDIYEADFTTSTIFKFTPAGAKTTFASASFPLGLAFDAAGNLFCVEKGSNSILKFTPAGVKTTFASGFSNPGHLALDASGNLFVGDGQTIVKITPGGVKSVFATGGFTVNPAFDPAGDLFAPQGASVVKFTPTGTRSTFASGFTNAVAVTFDNGGNVYVLDQNNNSNSIYKFTSAGAKSTFATTVSGGISLVYNGAGVLYTAGSGQLIAIRLSDAFQTVIASGLSSPTLKVEPPRGKSINIATRLNVQTGENVLIGGFIITGGGGKSVVIRGIGPSLAAAGVQGALQDPILELHYPGSVFFNTNDNWKDSQASQLQATGLAPTDDREAAFTYNLPPGNYTVVMKGKNNGTGIGLIEVYDIDQANGKLANISTRGQVGTDGNVMIGGFILGGNGSRVIVRAIGPSLGSAGIAGALSDPRLSLRNANGAEIAMNNNWKDTQADEIQATGISPSNDLEAAIIATLPNGNYTAILEGVNGATGVGLVEVYSLQ